MDDAISRQAAIDALGEQPDSGDWMDEWECGCRSQWERDREAIENLPAAQPKRPQGHWRITPMACYGGGTLTEFECSECEVHQIVVSNFCPNCGADMRGEQDE